MLEKNKKNILKNGLRLLFLPSKSNLFAVGFAINSGTYFENPGDEGIFHLLEHVIARQGLKGDSLKEKIYKEGARMDASTSVARTFYYLYSFPEDLEKSLKHFVKSIFFPKFLPEDISECKSGVLSEMVFSQDFSPYEVLRDMMWKDERLGRSIIGTKGSILEIGIEKLERYHKDYYSSENTSVVVMGNQLSDAVLNILETIPSHKTFATKIDASIKKPGYKVFQERNLHSTIAISFPTKGFSGLGESRHYFNLAATALNDYYISDLKSQGLVYEANWNWNVFSESGDLVVYLESLEKENVVNALKKSLELISEWSRLSLDEKRFELVRRHVILNLRMNESIVDALPLYTRNFSSSEEAHTYDEALKVYQSATVKDAIETVERVILSHKPFTVVSLGSDSMENLGKINQVLMDYYS